MNAQLALPLARTTDPAPSREAARKAARGMSELTRSILWLLDKRSPLSAFDIEKVLVGPRQGDTIRTRVSAMAKDGLLVKVDEAGVSPGGNSCARYRVRGEA